MLNRRYVIMVALTVALGGFLMGFDASVISGVVKFIEIEFELTKLELGWSVRCADADAADHAGCHEEPE